MKRQVHPFARCTCLIFWFFTESLGEEQLGGASADAQSYWQGRFAACAFVGGFLGSSHPRNSWGVAPNPTRDRRKGTKSPLDPFSRLSWSRFHAPSACSFLALRLSPCLLPQLSVMSLFLAHFPTQNLPNTSSSSFSSTSSPVISASAICACCKSTPAKSTE